jgi:uncharacterized protein (TIGR02444 family)
MPAEASLEGFWDFSVRTYRSDGVAEACLSLQNDHGADVNMLLYCCWAAGIAGTFTPDQFAEASEFSASWAGNVVKPLRSARTWMKHTGCIEDKVPTDDCMELREKIKSVEFAAEKMQQHVLESLLPASQSPNIASEQLFKDVVANLARYAGEAGIDISHDVRGKLVIIIAAAYPGSDPQEIENTFSNNLSE